MRFPAKMAQLWWKLIRFGFRLLYNELAFTYDIVSRFVSLGAWRCWQRAALKYLQSPHEGLVLELAHGTGDLQIDLKAARYRTIGYDLSPYMGRIAQRKLASQHLPTMLVQGTAQQLPFESGCFVSVVTTFPTDFIFESETLHEIYRVLVPTGLMVIVPNGQFVGGGMVERLLEWLYRITGQRSRPADNEIKTVYGLEIFETHGFTAEIFEEACPRSVAQVIIARKKG